MITRDCPYCGGDLEIEEDISDYDWKGCKGEGTVECPWCEKLVDIELEGYIEDVTVTTQPPPTIEEMERQRGDELCDLARDLEMEERCSL